MNEEVFGSMAEARALIEKWRRDFNTATPHSAHGGLTPAEARNRAAADRLRSPTVSADRPLPTTQRTDYATRGLSECSRDRRGADHMPSQKNAKMQRLMIF